MQTTVPTVLVTERLVLRGLRPDDAPALFAIFSDLLVVRFWSGSPWTELAQASAEIGQAIANFQNGTAITFGITLRDSDELVGQIRLHQFFAQNRRCEIGYALAADHWGMGYGSEALHAVLGHAFHVLNLNRIEADIDPRNIASAKVLARMGFVEEGYLRERWLVNGEAADSVIYGLLRKDWVHAAGRPAQPVMP